MTFLTFNTFVNEELDKFYEESQKHGDLKVPVDIQTDKSKKIWTGDTNKSKGLF